MSFPNKSDRKTCWESRDKYWECLDKHNVGMEQPSPEECQQVRKLYESMCPNQWVKHFDRKRNYLLFKAKIETEGYDPLQDNAANSVAPLGTARKQRPFKPVNIIRACHHIEAKAKNETETKTYYDPNVVHSGIKLSERLMSHIKSGLNSIDGKTLCSTAYCALFVILPEEYCEVCLRNLNTTLSCFLLQQISRMENNLTNTLMITNSLEERNEETKITTLISGLFQTNLLDKCHLPENSRTRQLVEAIMLVSFKISTKACLTYSSSTFVHFRNLHSILVKLIDWECCDRIIGDVQNVLLFVIFNNWENLLSGIREINLKIWKLFLNILDKSNAKHQDLFASITDCIFKFPWNKAKYFVLTEIIPHLKCDIVEFLNTNPMCFSGVDYSLRHSSLVSAGCDLYKTILDEFRSYKDWSDIFLALFYDVMSGNKTIAQSNLLNYWIPVTVKKYPELIESLLEFLYYSNKNNSNLSPLLSVMKLARKSGLILADWDSKEMKHDYKKVIEVGLVHINDDIRSRAIQVVCVTQKNNMPTTDEFRKMKVFLEYNINSDSTGFRQNNLNCFTIFLTRIRDSCLNILKNTVIVEKESNVQYLNEIESFFIWIHEFLIQNLDDRGNYQRKILSLQIYDVILRYLCGGYKDKVNIQKSLCRKGNLRDQGWKVAAYLDDRKKWLFDSAPSIKALISCISDSTTDIREIAVDILIQYFINNKTFKRSRENFFINGIILCNSRMFYEAGCGCLMFKMLAHLNRGRQELNDPIQKIIHPFDICEYLLNKAWEQFTYQETDLLLSIYNNQPLHGMISAINMYITHSEQQSTFKFISALKKFLGSVTNHFINILSCKGEACNMVAPPSFAEMGESIEYIIRSSELKAGDDEREKTEHLSNAHQLILNNIWLNLKACCDLSSTLLIHQTGRLQDSDIAALLDINISVLTRCRHKGAIESAGVSLGLSVKHLTSLDNPVYYKLFADILREFLAQSTSENIHGGSVTRKSAGLSILVHRIVSNDSEIGKPLFYLAMDVLLRVLSKSETHHEPTGNVASLLKEKDLSVISDMDVALDIANERDVPLARALHLLCRTVLESSLASYVIQFAPQLATVCFNHLINDQWQVRNAALQLYGALVPKLIGQKKSQGEDNFVKSSVSPDELFSHVPSLWNYIKASLQEASAAQNILTAHSNIVPILSLLSSMANRYAINQFCLEETEKFGISVANLEDIFPNLIMLIGSPIYNIRNITATIIASFFDLPFFVNHWNIIKNCPLKENELHGYLLTLKQYAMYYMSFKNYLFKQEEKDEILKTLKTILDNMNMIIVEKNSSFIVKALHLEIEQSLNDDQRDYVKLVGDGFETIMEYNDNIDFQIGIHHWLQLNVVHAIQNCHEFELLPILKQCVNSNSAILADLDFWSVVKGRIDCSLSSEHKTLQEIFEYLIELSCERKKRVSKLIYEILYVISTKCGSITYTGLLGRIYCNLYIEDVMQSYHYGYLLPLVCSMACDKDISCSNTDLHLELSRVCKQLSKPERFEAANRRMAAVSMKHLVKLLQYYRQKNIITENVHEIKCNILVACLWLLQDEDSSLRTECSRMHLARKDNDVLNVHPNIHIGTILSASYLQKIFCGSKRHIITFLQSLLKEINANTSKKTEKDLQNPFDHDTPNVYWEPMLMYKSALKLKIVL